MSLGLGLGLPYRQGGGAAAFNPASLFTGGLAGYFYDVADLSTLFQDTAGTTPAVADSPVQRINDKSGNGNHLTQATMSKAPLLKAAGGLYWLEFDGTDDVLFKAATNKPFVTNTESEWMLATRITVASPATQMCLVTQASGSADLGVGTTDIGAPGVTRNYYYDGVTFLDKDGTLVYDTDKIIGGAFNGDKSIQANGDGVLSTAGTSATAPSAATSTHFCLGSNLTTSTTFYRFYKGRIYTAFGIQPRLSAPNRALMTTFMAARQGRVL